MDKNKIQSIVEDMYNRTYRLGMGAGKLASIYKCTRDEVYEAKNIVKKQLEHKKEQPKKLKLKSRWQSANGQWLESYKAIEDDIDVTPEDIFTAISKRVGDVKPVQFVMSNINAKANEPLALNIWIADEHIGADTKDGLFANEYDEKELTKRFTKITDHITYLASIYGQFDTINIGVLGDTFDGWNGQTTRGGHKLPQSLNNRKAFDTFLRVYLQFLDTLLQIRHAANYNFYMVANSNHGGDFDYLGYKTLELYMNKLYPDVNVIIYEKFLNHFHYGVHTFIITHGKDQENRKFGLPLYMNEPTKNFLNDYKELHDMKSHIHLIKGDLHRSNSDYDRLCSSNSSFSYHNVASMFGASKWIMENYGATMPMCDYNIVAKNNGFMMDGRIYLK